MSHPHPPICPTRPRTFHEFGETRDDPYFWLRDRDDPAVRAYVEAENAYFDRETADPRERSDALFEGLKSRTEPEAYDPPFPVGPRYAYGSRTPIGAEYAIHFRVPRESAGKEGTREEIVLDVNALAAGVEYCELGAFVPSPDDRLVAYAIDSDGSEHHTIFVREVATGRTLPVRVPHTAGDLAWSADSSVLFYARVNEHDRTDRVFRHRIGEDAPDGSGDELVHFERDARFFVDVTAAGPGGEYVAILADSKESNETYLLRADAPFESARSFLPRRERHRYSVEPFGGAFVVLSNRRERNFDLFRTATIGGSERDWQVLREGDARIDYRDVVAFDRFLAIRYGEAGEHRIDLVDRAFAPLRTLSADEPFAALDFDANEAGDRDWIRLSTRSMRSLPEVFEIEAFTGERRLLHRREIPGYDASLYAVERFEAPSADGTMIPATVLYRRDRREGDRPLPTILYGYGAYGHPNDPRFGPLQTLACDLGFAWVTALVRGGGELGPRWYDGGKFLKKENSFLDLRAVAEAIVARGDARRGDISIFGGSAGGLLVTATARLDPMLFRSVVALVPFVDVLNTMLDETLPLTPNEFDEWGNPKQEEYYRAIRAYSPYDTLTAAAPHPHLLMIAGWNDPRVTYWEPLKYVARLRAILREVSADGPEAETLVLLNTHLESGHGGASGRYEHLRDSATVLAFLERVHGR